MFLKNVFSLFKHENVLSGVAVDTGNVDKIFNNLNIFGKIESLHNCRASNPDLGFFSQQNSFYIIFRHF